MNTNQKMVMTRVVMAIVAFFVMLSYAVDGSDVVAFMSVLMGFVVIKYIHDEQFAERLNKFF